MNENKLECELELYFKNVENENINVNCEFDFGALSPIPSPTPNPTPNPTPPPRPLTVLIFIGIIFVNEINEINEINQNVELQCELEFVNVNVNYECKNVNCDFYFYDYGDLCNGLHCPTPAPRPTTYNFINSRGGLREQLVLKDVFDTVYGEYDLNNVCEGCFNESIYDNKYDYGLLLSPPTPAPAPLPTIEFNCINAGLPGNNMLRCIYGVDNNEYVFDNKINQGMFVLFLKIFQALF